MTQFPKYDDVTRERIRRGLLVYKQTYRIGAPRLANLIGAAHPNKVEVDQRRVSRFLRKKTYPDDVFIDWCQIFLNAAPPSIDPLREVAAGLLAFCNLSGVVEVDYSGTYEVKSVADPGDFTVHERLSIVRDEGFWRVETQNMHDRSENYGGVLVQTVSYGFALLSHRLTGDFLIFTIEKNGDNLAGTHLMLATANRSKNKPVTLEAIHV